MVKLLLRKGADVNLQYHSDGSDMLTCLHHAARRGNAPLTAVLLEYGADPCILDRKNRTAFDVGQSSEVQSLLRDFLLNRCGFDAKISLCKCGMPSATAAIPASAVTASSASFLSIYSTSFGALSPPRESLCIPNRQILPSLLPTLWPRPRSVHLGRRNYSGMMYRPHPTPPSIHPVPFTSPSTTVRGSAPVFPSPPRMRVGRCGLSPSCHIFNTTSAAVFPKRPSRHGAGRRTSGIHRYHRCNL